MDCARFLCCCMWEQIGNLVFLPKLATLAWAKTHETHPPFLREISPRRANIAWARVTLSSKRDSLAWARIRPKFELFSILSLAQARMTRLSERAFLPRRDLLAWARTATVECYFFVSNGWSYVWSENMNLLMICMNCYDW